jgi:hypothetical protein
MAELLNLLNKKQRAWMSKQPGAIKSLQMLLKQGQSGSNQGGRPKVVRNNFGTYLPVVPIRKARNSNVEHITVPSDGSYALNGAHNYTLNNLHLDIGTNFLPTGGKYVGQDQRFIVSQCVLELKFHHSNYLCGAWILLVVRESSENSIVNQDITFTNTQTVEEAVGTIISGSGYDFEIITPSFTSTLALSNAGSVVFVGGAIVNLKSYVDRIVAEYYSTTENVSRKYDLLLLTQNGATTPQTLSREATLLIEGKMELERNRLL